MFQLVVTLCCICLEVLPPPTSFSTPFILVDFFQMNRRRFPFLSPRSISPSLLFVAELLLSFADLKVFYSVVKVSSFKDFAPPPLVFVLIMK